MVIIVLWPTICSLHNYETAKLTEIDASVTFILFQGYDFAEYAAART